jgi:two-component system, OmpR family, sensor histidine kinase ChvG
MASATASKNNRVLTLGAAINKEGRLAIDGNEIAGHPQNARRPQSQARGGAQGELAQNELSPDKSGSQSMAGSQSPDRSGIDITQVGLDAVRDQESTASVSSKTGSTKTGSKSKKPMGRALAAAFTGIRRSLGITIFSSLTRRIVILNLAALLALMAGILFLNQWRAGLIDARVQSLRVQGEIISAAVAASATVDSDVITVNPDRLLDLQSSSTFSTLSFFDPTLEFPISPERVAPLLRNLVTPTRTRARIYDRDGFLILDSASIYVAGEVITIRGLEEKKPSYIVDTWNRLLSWVPGENFPLYQEYGGNEGKRYPEVEAALNGAPADIVRVDQDSKLLISVAVPIKRSRAIVGALLLSTESGEIDAIVASERLGVLRTGLIAAAVTTILSLFLAGTIAEPMRRLSAAAERVQSSKLTRAEIPDFTDRSDEIGHLSGALRAMTDALYDRIEDIERFAADVAHELKNPLTSLRSAVETLPLIKSEKDRDQLTAIIIHDVQRLDRLISDISNASRLDAELARDDSARVEIEGVVRAMISMHEEAAKNRDITISLEVSGEFPAVILGQDSRLAQVVSNLIDNAISFSPEGGKVLVAIQTSAEHVILRVMDEGQGILGDTGHIFDRFYTDRPAKENFGNHSGLGLSISRQIIKAHDGKISARNRHDASGAEFIVQLPRADAKPAAKK